jgi:predicted transposase YbfD/YdcC
MYLRWMLYIVKKTVEAIVASKNDYIIKVKKNQPKLQTAIQAHTEQTQPVQVKVEDDSSRGRKVKRLVEVFTPPPDIDPSWQKVMSVIRVTRSGVRKNGIAYSTLSYYISSLPPTSTRITKVIRQHWHIENRLHWVKNVIFNEDESKQRAGKTPINLSII